MGARALDAMGYPPEDDRGVEHQKEAVRALKRQMNNAVFRRLRVDAAKT
jgi:hypothetical protein